ncbi:MAG: helix-turn-helix transcriptional regulator [Candidatus Nomurabacteria bacterium]|nr:MAG: helix-turn-helix transcriptional regulator [Candidatus Nomurabacteria bacterium]
MGAKEHVNSNLAKYRRMSGLTQEQLALHVNVTRQTIIAIEKGNYVPSVLLALKIAKVFNTSVERIFYYEDK